MTNKNAPSGADITNAIQSAIFKPNVSEYVIPASDTTDYFINDFVRTNETSEDGIPIAIKAAAGEVMRGIIIGFKPDARYQNRLYRKGGIRRIALVNEDPFITFVIQATGTLTSTAIGKNADILVGAGSTATGISGTQLDSSTLTTSTGQLKLLRIVDSPISELGEYTQVICMIYEHELNSGASAAVTFHNTLLNLTFDTANHGVGKTGFQRGTTNDSGDPTVNDDDTQGYRAGDFWINTTTDKAFICVDPSTGAAQWDQIEHSASDIWDRSGTTIEPSNVGDDLDMGTGDITATNGNFTGKLTVGGLIDPTALVLDPQTSAPITVDGVLYYNSTATKFEFRENGVWRDLNATGLWQRITGATDYLMPLTGGDELGATGDRIAEGWFDSVTSTSGNIADVSFSASGIDFSAAANVQTMILDSTAISHYDAHPTFTGDTDIIDKKYVDDIGVVLGQIDPLTVTFDGRVNFTLSQPIVAGSVAFAFVRGHGFFELGYGFTAIGTSLTWLNPQMVAGDPSSALALKTTDRFVVAYNYNLGSSVAPQYWQRIGTDLTPFTLNDAIRVDSVGGIQVGAGGQNITLFDTDVTLAADSDSRFATQKAIKDYVDNHTTNGVWTRTGTEITVTNAGDTINLNTAGIMKSAVFDALNIPAYNTLPTLTDDKQLANKKYVDDHSGTGLPQLQIYYVGDAGSDSNDGKSVDFPFLTGSHAINVVAAQSSSDSNRFEIEVIGAAEVSLTSKTLPVYTTFNASESKVTLNNLIMNGHSKFYFDTLVTPDTGVAIQITSAGAQRVIRGKVTIPGTNSTFLAESNAAHAFVQVDTLDMNDTGSTIFTSVGSGGTIFFDCNNYIEDQGSSPSSALIIRDVRAEGFNGDTRQSTANTFLYDVQGTRTLELKPGAPKWTNTPLFGAALSTPHTIITGGGALYKILYDVESIDVTSDMDLINHWFVASLQGWYSFTVSVKFSGILPENNSCKINLQVDTGAGVPWGTFELHDINVGPARSSGNVYRFATTEEFLLPAGYRVYVTVKATRSSGSGNNMGVAESIFNGRLVRQTT